MNDDLHRVLRGRADRAPVPHDVDSTIDLVVSSAEQHTRRRRNRLAVASGAAVVVAAATVGIAVADSGTGETAGPGTTQSFAAGASPSIGRPGIIAHSRGRRPALYSDSLPAPGAHPSTTDQLSLKEKRALQAALRAKQRQAAKARLAAQKLAAEARDAGGSLKSADPAPKKAEISLGLVPKGFVYLSYDSANTYYGLPGTSPDDYFSDGIVVDVHQFIGDIKDYTLTVNGKPASYGKSGGFTIVRVLYSKHVDVGFQAPPSAKLTKAQALKMAGSLDVRSTKNRTHG